MQPAVAVKHLGSLFGVLIVAQHNVVALYPKLAVHDLVVLTGINVAHGMGLCICVEVSGREVCALGKAVACQKVYAVLSELGHKTGRYGSRAAKYHVQISQKCRALHAGDAENDLNYTGHENEGGGSENGDEPYAAFDVGAGAERVARVKSGEKSHDSAENVGERQHHYCFLVQRVALVNTTVAAAAHKRAVGEHRAFGRAGRAAGEEYCGDRVLFDIRGGRSVFACVSRVYNGDLQPFGERQKLAVGNDGVVVKLCADARNRLRV